MKPKVRIVKTLNAWKVHFEIGNQGFSLSESPTKAEALWFARMLRKAFRNLTTGDITNE